MYFIRFHQAPNRYTSAWFCVISLKRSIPPGLESGDRWYQLDSLHGGKNISKLFYSLVGLNYCSRLIIRPWKSSPSSKVAGFLGWSMEQSLVLLLNRGKSLVFGLPAANQVCRSTKVFTPHLHQVCKMRTTKRRQKYVYIDVYCISWVKTYQTNIHIWYETYEDIHTSNNWKEGKRYLRLSDLKTYMSGHTVWKPIASKSKCPSTPPNSQY